MTAVMKAGFESEGGGGGWEWMCEGEDEWLEGRIRN